MGLRFTPATLMVLVTSMLLAGCGAHTIDTKNAETAKKTIAIMAHNAPDELQAQTKAAEKAFVDAYFGNVAPPPEAPNWHEVQGMDAVEFVAFVHGFLTHPSTSPHVPVSNGMAQGYILRNYRQTMQTDITLQEEMRDIAQRKNFYTIDQFVLGTPQVVPPAPGLFWGSDPLTLKIPIRNRTRFDITKPTFHITLTNTTSNKVLFDADMTAENAVLSPDKTMTVVLMCCDMGENREANMAVRKHPDEVQMAYTLVKVSDYRKGNWLDKTYFPMASYHRVTAEHKCLKAVDNEIKTGESAATVPACHEW